MNDNNNGDDSISVQLETQNGNDGDVSDDGEQQVFMLLNIAIISCIMQYSKTRPILFFLIDYRTPEEQWSGDSLTDVVM
jgi:hypothetical protein